MKQKWPFFVVVLLLLIGIVGSFLVYRRPDTELVEIVQDEEVLHRINLSQAEDQTIKVEYEGRVNKIEIKDHQIHMLEAECPDHTCINMGWLDSTAPIVCLPNHLVIRFAGAGDDLDVIVG